MMGSCGSRAVPVRTVVPCGAEATRSVYGSFWLQNKKSDQFVLLYSGMQECTTPLIRG